MMKTHDKVYIERLRELSRLSKVEMQFIWIIHIPNMLTKFTALISGQKYEIRKENEMKMK